MITQSTLLPLEYGEFKISYHTFDDGACLSASYGDITHDTPVVRIHSSCLFGESFHGLDCECSDQLSSTFRRIVEHGSGVIIYQYAEGRGIGIEAKIRALELQRTKKLDTVEAFKLMGLPPDLRTYDVPIKALKDLNVASKVIFSSQNPNKLKAMETAGYEIDEILYPEVGITIHNKPELLTKKNKLGYSIEGV